MPSLRHTSAIVRPLARSRSASRSRRTIWSAVRRLLMSPSWTYSIPDWDSHNAWTRFRGAGHRTPKITGPVLFFATGSVNRESTSRPEQLVGQEGIAQRPVGLQQFAEVLLC